MSRGRLILRLISISFILLSLAVCAAGQGSQDILDQAKPEPKMLAFSRTISYSGSEWVSQVVTDKQGNIYVVGSTTSLDFPVSPGALRASFDPTKCSTDRYGQRSCEGARFVMKLDPTASTVLQAATIPGSWSVWATAVSGDGSLLITGTSRTLPTTPGAYRTTCGGESCVFLMKLVPDFTAIQFSTYLGGTTGFFWDVPYQVLVDAQARVWVIGSTKSGDFPVTPDAVQSRPGGGDDDIFLSIISADGSRLVYSTFLGGNGSDGAKGTLLTDERILLSGGTSSTNFPTTQDAFQKTLFGERDGILATLDLTGGLKYSTLLGGARQDAVQAEPSNLDLRFFFVASSNSPDFPGTESLGGSAMPQSVTLGQLDGSSRTIHSRRFLGNWTAKFLSREGGVAWVIFMRAFAYPKGPRLMLAKISLEDSSVVSAYELPDGPRPFITSTTVGLSGTLIGFETRYLDNDEAKKASILVGGFRYAERELAWQGAPSPDLTLAAGDVRTFDATLRTTGSGVTPHVRVKCEQVPADLECSISANEIDVEESHTFTVVLERKVSLAGLFFPPLGGLIALCAFRRRKQYAALVVFLGIALAGCGPVNQTGNRRTIHLTAESSTQRTSIPIEVVYE